MSYHVRPERAATPGSQETVQQIERRLNRQLREVEEQRIRTETKLAQGPRTVADLKREGLISKRPA